MGSYSFLQGSSLLITGGTGSFGRALIKELLRHELCRRIIVFSRDEWKQWQMRDQESAFQHPSLRYFLGDVRDKDRLRRAFHDVDYVVHAAALKQVPVAEYNPTEFLYTNTIGAINVIDAAIDRGVKKVIALSTDKAVNPVNLYGATKLCADKIFVSGNFYVGRGQNTLFSVARYGNVLGSRGSVITYWRHLLEQGATRLPITDLRMTRFWITLDEAVRFVLSSLQNTQGGEIFIPKIPSMRVVDMAEAMAPGLDHEVIGIRPGEKLHEVMFGSEHSHHTLELDDRYVIVPAWRRDDDKFLQPYRRDGALPWVAEGFSYTSNTNDQWLDVATLRRLLGQL